MKNLSVLFSALALIGVIALFGLRMSENKTTGAKQPANKEQLADTKGRIAYVNIDTLEAQYEYLKSKKADFETRKKSMTSELERSQKQLQDDYVSAQRKISAQTMTEVEAEATSKRLQQMQQSLQSREAALTEQLMKEQDEFNKDLQERLDAFLEEYNKDKNFDYILSYSKALGFIMLANDQLDITADVVTGMNELYKKEGPKENKEAKKKNK